MNFLVTFGCSQNFYDRFYSSDAREHLLVSEPTAVLPRVSVSYLGRNVCLLMIVKPGSNVEWPRSA